MGVVYLAQNKLMGRLEVLKVVGGHLVNRRGVLDRFQIEIRNAARLHHPNIVTAYSAIRLGESLALAMEYVDGFDLTRLVKAKGPLPVANACNYIHQAALGLHHAHEQGMVHRDIKPSNLMLTRQGSRALIKVLDFGLAKVKSEGAVDGGLTNEGQMLGTPHYIAPEQTIDARRADIRADVYSLGCTFYYLLTGGPPFDGTSLYDILQAHHSREATPLNLARPEVPVELAALVAKMMAKEPERRFQEPKEVAQALKPFFKSGALEGTTPKAEVSRTGQSRTGRTTGEMTSAPKGLKGVGTPPPVLSTGRTSQPALRPESMWQSLMETSQSQPKSDGKRAGTAYRLPRWLWPSVAAAFLFACVALGITITIRTKSGETKISAPDGQPFRAKVDDVIVQNQPIQDSKGSNTSESRGNLGPQGAIAGRRSDSDDTGKSDPSNVSRTINSTQQRNNTQQPRFVLLFNGEDIHDWKTHPSQAGGWRVEDGILIGSGRDTSHLYTLRNDFQNFHLRVEARYQNGSSGGIFLRSSFGPSVPLDAPKWTTGYEALISSNRSGRGMTGPLYSGENADMVWAAADLQRVPPGQWFTLDAIADGKLVAVMINGKMSAYHADPRRAYSSGHIALHYEPHSVIEFRKIEIKEFNGWKAPRELLRFAGHESRVSTVAISSDGQNFISGGNSHEREVYKNGANHTRGNDNTLRLWSTVTGRIRLVMTEHPWNIRGLAMSDDGRYAASCSNWYGLPNAKILLVWDLKMGRRIRRLSWSGAPERAFVIAVGFSPDSHLVRGFYNNGTVVSWDVGTGSEQPLTGLKGDGFKDDEFSAAAFLPDGRHLVAGSQNGTVEIWDSTNGTSMQSFVGHTGAVRDVAFSTDGRVLLSGSTDKTMRLWDVTTGSEIKFLTGDDKDLWCVALSPDGKRALSGGNDAIVRLWDLGRGEEICRLEGHTMRVSAVGFSKDGRRAVSGSDDSTVRLWELP
jgi:serine/threonine protein kinase